MPKSFCSGEVVFQDVYDYTLEDVIFLLENREFSEFGFNTEKGYSIIYSDAGEILTEHKGSDNAIPEETVRRMLNVLEHIEECIEKAYDRIINPDQKDDKASPANEEKWIPDLKQIFEINGINFGDISSLLDHCSVLIWSQSRRDHHPKCASDSFSIEFDGDDHFFFNVKFDYRDMLPYEIELRKVKNT